MDQLITLMDGFIELMNSREIAMRLHVGGKSSESHSYAHFHSCSQPSDGCRLVNTSVEVIGGVSEPQRPGMVIRLPGSLIVSPTRSRAPRMDVVGGPSDGCLLHIPPTRITTDGRDGLCPILSESHITESRGLSPSSDTRAIITPR